MWGEELSCSHQGKRAGEQQVRVDILVIRPESEVSVSQGRSLTVTDIHTCLISSALFCCCSSVEQKLEALEVLLHM